MKKADRVEMAQKIVAAIERNPTVVGYQYPDVIRVWENHDGDDAVYNYSIPEDVASDSFLDPVVGFAGMIVHWSGANTLPIGVLKLANEQLRRKARVAAVATR